MEHARAPRYHLPLSICLLDVDSFKQYNDAFGHPAGDQVLIRVAALLSESVRDTDFVARYGGEEFVLILPHTDVEGARTVAERCRTAIVQAAWPCRPVTASFGVSTLHDGIASASELIALADQALYAAKGAGRNRVMHIDEIETPAG
jgi:diguanylate cyclase (GGDEF)-like protein